MSTSSATRYATIILKQYMNSWNRCSTARGSSTGFFLEGTTKAHKLVLFTKSSLVV